MLCAYIFSCIFLMFFIRKFVFLSFSFCIFVEAAYFRKRKLANLKQELVIKIVSETVFKLIV